MPSRPNFEPGARVRLRSSGAKGTFKGLDESGKKYIVELEGGTLAEWSCGSVSIVAGVRRPRGLTTATEKAHKAHALWSKGMKPKDIALLMGVTPTVVSTWIKKVEDALFDERMTKRTG